MEAFGDEAAKEEGKGAAGGGAGRRRGSGGTRKDRREAARWRIAKWEELSREAATWPGWAVRPGDKRGLARDPMLRKLMATGPTTRGERQRAQEVPGGNGQYHIPDQC